MFPKITTKLMPWLCLLLLAGLVFSLATLLQPRASEWNARGSENVLNVLFGDGRRLFANHFSEKADVYFHSGYYPSIFDRPQTSKDDHDHHLGNDEPGHEKEEAEHEKEMSFLGPPTDWIERFGRHFLITEHTHLNAGNEREILPWLKLAAELDPQNIQNYTLAAYWLRRLGKPQEAEQFLRDGLKANPTSYELLFELGKIVYENDHDLNRARNLWKLALRYWREQEAGKKEPNKFVLDEIAMKLAKLEEEQGNWAAAIGYLEQAKEVSPHPEDPQRQIDALRKKMAAPQ